MKTVFNIDQDQITLKKQLWYHFYPGIAFILVYSLISKTIIDLGYPGFAPLLITALFVLTPIALMHLFWKGKQLNGKFSLKNVIAFTEKLSFGQYVKWSLIGIIGCFVIYIPLFPAGLYLKENIFHWLPQWYFDPGYGVSDTKILASFFLIAIIIDGIIIPVIEELFFRGYLLPRMSYLKKWAPFVNGTLFGLYHFWQPHNYPAIIGIGIILSYIVWKKKNVHLGIIIHCSLNILGAISGYLAATGGNIIPR